jgi:hypothetical protein
MSINLSALMKQRYDTAANWTAQNPTLLAGEIGIESDTKKWKVGTGSTAWTSLTYAIGGTYPIVNADIAAGAEIAVSKLADGSARQLLQTDAAGTGVEWTSDVSIPGVLSVTAGTAALPGIAVAGDPNTGLYSPGADQLAISTNGTSRIVVDASGNVNIDSDTFYVDAANNRVGIGTQSPAYPLDVTTGGGNGLFQVAPTTGVITYYTKTNSGGYGSAINDATQHIWHTSGTEKARILSAGNFLVGTSSVLQGGANNFSVILANFTAQFGLALCSTQTTGTANYSQFVYNGTINGSISSNGTTTTYAITSDYRLKENVTAVTDSITRFKQLKPSRFNFIADPDQTVDGFLAHEAQAVVPECVTGEKDAVDDNGNPVYQGIDQSKLVPLLTAALQEAIAKIESLETRLSALEGA